MICWHMLNHTIRHFNSSVCFLWFHKCFISTDSPCLKMNKGICSTISADLAELDLYKRNRPYWDFCIIQKQNFISLSGKAESPRLKKSRLSKPMFLIPKNNPLLISSPTTSTNFTLWNTHDIVLDLKNLWLNKWIFHNNTTSNTMHINFPYSQN
jgi:hypothetical protein